ncbi:polyprenyl synthetase family protein [Kitasatospora sp. NPDC089797]|uniref:polyprenyl synthetase family protein n=1 Tax=Kitasatospora sp. NPDC089797 TaxID=3155298 RepID=UPI003415CE86
MSAPRYTPTAQAVQDRITSYADTFGPLLRSYLIQLGEAFDHPAESAFTPNALSLVSDLALAGGKRQRAAFVYEAARLPGTEAVAGAADIGALAIELLQTALLIHDDLVDNSSTRRGIRSTFGSYTAQMPAHPQYAMGMTVMAGDLASYLAADVIAASDLPADLALAMTRVILRAGKETYCGQMIDLERDFTALPDLAFLDTVSDYKSGRYSIIAPIQLGLLAAGHDPAPHHDTLHRYSRAVGILGQIRDDYISFFGDPKVTGKPDSVDARAGRLSYPLREALAAATIREKHHMRTVLGRTDATDADIDMVRDIAYTHGVDETLRTMMGQRAQQARDEAATWHLLGWDPDAVGFFAESTLWGAERAS